LAKLLKGENREFLTPQIPLRCVDEEIAQPSLAIEFRRTDAKELARLMNTTFEFRP
jgi:hypothetical protein